MSNLKQKHKDYLIKNEIKDLTDLVNYIEILRNTSNLQGEDRQMLFDFAFLTVNEQLSLKYFFAENREINETEYITEVKKSLENFALNKYLENKNPRTTEDLNKMGCSPTQSKEFFKVFKKFAENDDKNSPTFMDEVLGESNYDSAFNGGFTSLKKEDWKVLEENRTETSTEIPKFISINIEQILPKHIFDTIEKQEGKRPVTFSYRPNQEIGKKESQIVKKAPIFTFCKQMKNAVEKLALRSLYGHEKYEKEDDWENFSRVVNADFEYSNSQFRHALEIGGEETEEEHLTASAWNAIAKLELYLRSKKLKKC